MKHFPLKKSKYEDEWLTAHLLELQCEVVNSYEKLGKYYCTSRYGKEYIRNSVCEDEAQRGDSRVVQWTVTKVPGGLNITKPYFVFCGKFQATEDSTAWVERTLDKMDVHLNGKCMSKILAEFKPADANHLRALWLTLKQSLTTASTATPNTVKAISTIPMLLYNDNLKRVTKLYNKGVALSENPGIIEREGGEEAGKLLARNILKELLKTP